MSLLICCDKLRGNSRGSQLLAELKLLELRLGLAELGQAHLLAGEAKLL